MLTFYPEGVVPADTTAIANGAAYNNDGHGYAIVAGSRLIIKKSMNADYLIGQFMRDRATHPRGPALFHSRIGTAGATDKSNCHPFHLRGDRRTIVAHNGILPAMAQPSKKDRRSDTRLAADSILPHKFGFLGYAPNRVALAKWAGAWNKLVILTVNPQYSARSYIINESSGVWDGGVWYSNDDYRGWTVPACITRSLARSRHVDDGWDCDTEDECPFCGVEGRIDRAARACTLCETCLDCLHCLEGCGCYVPDSLRRRDDSAHDEEDYLDWWLTTDTAKREQAVETE
jgi:glutamine amidotransferase